MLNKELKQTTEPKAQHKYKKKTSEDSRINFTSGSSSYAEKMTAPTQFFFPLQDSPTL